MKKWKSLLLLLVLAVTVTACGARQQTAEKLQIVVVPACENDPWAQALGESVRAYYESHDRVNVYQQGTYEPDGFLQMQLVEDLIAQEVDAICVIPEDPALLDPMLARAQAQEIVVVSWHGEALKHVDDNLEAEPDPAALAGQLIDRAVELVQAREEQTHD